MKMHIKMVKCHFSTNRGLIKERGGFVLETIWETHCLWELMPSLRQTFYINLLANSVILFSFSVLCSFLKKVSHYEALTDLELSM